MPPTCPSAQGLHGREWAAPSEGARTGSGRASNMTKVGWLQCESIERGMFSDELAVVIRRSNGATESYFVPAQDVERARTRVRVAVREAGNLLWATV